MKSLSVRLPARGLNWQSTPQGLLKMTTLGMKMGPRIQGRAGSTVLVGDEVVVSRQSEELEEVFVQREFLEHFRTLWIFAARIALVAEHLPDFFEFLRHQFAE